MTPTKLNRAPLTKRISALAITAAAALSFVVFSPNAQAATPLKPTKEFRALETELSQLGTNIDDADPGQLAQAVTNAIANNSGLKPGNIAGEALKYAANQEAGDDIGLALANAVAGDAAADVLAARDAIKRAGSGKGLNVNMVPDFSQVFFATNGDAIALARLVISTKAGAGAVIGGRADQITDTVGNDVEDQKAFAIEALAKTARLTAAATDIAKYVVNAVWEEDGDTADFTHDIAVANTTLASKIGTGGVAGDPTNGGDIVHALLSESSLPKLKSGVAAFIKSVAKVADIEQITKIALAVGTQIDTAAGTSTAIKFSKANGVVKSLAKAIMAKATSPTVENSTSDYTFTNKQDEIAEVAAYMVGKVLNLNTINGAGGGKPQVTATNVRAKILAIIKSAVGVAKGKKVATAAGSTFYPNVAQDVTGSVVETLVSLRELASLDSVDDAFFNDIVTFLKAKAGVIAGKANAGVVTAAIDLAFEATGSDPDLDFEDGTIDGIKTIADNSVPDPGAETDFRPF